MAYGFILPRLFLEFYGSAVNGLISSITQFLGFVALAECGVGAVVQSALYKPLAEKDSAGLSRIIVAAEHFFRNIAKILVVYTVVLVVVFPNVISGNFDFVYTASLIGIIAISSFAQYYFGITYRLLLNSDQFGFIPILVQIIALTLNLIISVVLMNIGSSVHVVKFMSSIVFLMQPLCVSFVAHRWYKIDRKVTLDKSAIPQKWNGLAQHVSSVVLQSSGVTVLTLLSTLENVSVYSIYFLVVQGVRNITMSVTNGIQAFLGNLFAKGDMVSFKENFENFEWKLHFVVSVVFAVTSTLIVPFVGVYTKGVSDVNYIVPLFGMLLSAAWGMYCLRLPYNIVVLAVGHYKQTQNSAIIEAALNLVTASILVFNFGLVGVAIGTLVAMVYRTSYLACYISRYVINRNLWPFIRHFIVDAIAVGIYIYTIFLVEGSVCMFDAATAPQTYVEWALMAAKHLGVGLVVVLSVNVLFYRKNILKLIKKSNPS